MDQGIARRFFWLAAFALGGCATVSDQRFNPAENGHIRTVALVSVPANPTASIRNFGSPAALIGGGIGAGIAAAASESGNMGPFAQLMTQQGFDFSREAQQALTQRLTKLGYKVVLVQVPRTNPHALLGDYGKVPAAGADAILDVTTGVHFGYSNVNLLDNKFRPHLHFHVHLLDAKTRKTLYAEQVLYGYTNPFISATKVAAPQKYFYESSEAVLADPKNTVDGLRFGIQLLAERMAEQLAGEGQAAAR